MGTERVNLASAAPVSFKALCSGYPLREPRYEKPRAALVAADFGLQVCFATHIGAGEGDRAWPSPTSLEEDGREEGCYPSLH
jgi:hypothetical protein